MIVEVTPELVLAVLRTGNEIHAKILEGISADYALVAVSMNSMGNVEFLLQHKNDETPSAARHVITVGTLPCAKDIVW